VPGGCFRKEPKLREHHLEVSSAPEASDVLWENMLRIHWVGRCRLSVFKLVLKAPMISVLEI